MGKGGGSRVMPSPVRLHRPGVCGVSVMGKPTVYAATLARAAVAVGGEAHLATALHVPVADLRRWLHGEVYPETEVYQKALDLLIATGGY
jgi:hypothetical protein